MKQKPALVWRCKRAAYVVLMFSLQTLFSPQRPQKGPSIYNRLQNVKVACLCVGGKREHLPTMLSAGASVSGVVAGDAERNKSR